MPTSILHLAVILSSVWPTDLVIWLQWEEPLVSVGGVYKNCWTCIQDCGNFINTAHVFQLFLLVKRRIYQASQHWFNLPIFRIPITSPVPFHTGKAYFLFTGPFFYWLFMANGNRTNTVNDVQSFGCLATAELMSLNCSLANHWHVNVSSFLYLLLNYKVSHLNKLFYFKTFNFDPRFNLL